MIDLVQTLRDIRRSLPRPSAALPRKAKDGLEASFWRARSGQKALEFWSRAPVNPFTTNGYEVIPDAMPRAECERLVALARSLQKPHSYRVSGDCYTTVRHEKRGSGGTDLNVSQIMNIERIDAGLKKLVDARWFQRFFEERVGEPVEVKGVSIQVDGIDTETKRGYHLDGTFPPNFKAFIYLNDVTEFGDGPYTVIARSHRDIFRKATNEFFNSINGWEHSDQRLFYRDDMSTSFLAPAGTMILSTQDLAHKGWHDQHKSVRTCLIAFLNLRRFFDGKPIRLGIDRLPKDPSPAP